MACGAGSASAEEPENYYQADGVRLGAFTAYPSLRGSIGIDDNVYAQESNEVDDTYYELSPALRLQSDWSRHELVLQFTNQNVWYDTQSSEDHHDWSVGGEGRVDVSYATTIQARATYAELHELRGDSNVLGNAAEPTPYGRFDGYAEIRHRFNRLGVAAGAGLSDFDYDDVAALGGGTIDNDNRDRTVTLYQGEVNYAVSPDTYAFVRGIYNTRDYDLQPPAVLFNRDSEGYEVNGGLRFDLTHLIEGEVYGGYLEQDYDALPDIDGFSYGANFDYAITRLTTISVDAGRTIEETNQAGSPGYLSSSVGGEVRHELRRNIILTAGAAYVNNDYEASTREEDIWTAELGGKYLMNRNLSLEAGYHFGTRDSTLALSDYERNRVWIALTGQF
jgi:hypothetical protein